MTWKITYYNDLVGENVLELPDTLLARYLKMTAIMKEFGPNIGMPHTQKTPLQELKIAKKRMKEVKKYETHRHS